MVRVAAQLHDYGKIGIADSILKKEGPLNELERKEIETHAAKSEEILSQIKFLRYLPASPLHRWFPPRAP